MGNMKESVTEDSMAELAEYKMVLELISTIPTVQDGKYIPECAKVFQQMAKNVLEKFA